MKNNEDLEVKPVKGFSAPIEGEVLENSNFRKVLYTSNHMQVVLMSLLPGEDIGEEIHNANDQFSGLKVATADALLTEMYIKLKMAMPLWCPPVPSIT